MNAVCSDRYGEEKIGPFVENVHFYNGERAHFHLDYFPSHYLLAMAAIQTVEFVINITYQEYSIVPDRYCRKYRLSQRLFPRTYTIHRIQGTHVTRKRSHVESITVWGQLWQ
jgi:hypothetical protein